MDLEPQFKMHCESRSTRYRAQLKLKAFDPLPGCQLARHLNVPMVSIDQLQRDYGVEEQIIQQLRESKKWSAMLIGPPAPFIVRHPLANDKRSESDIMHELSHYILGHKQLNWSEDGIPIRRAIDEEEAIYLGSCLQIPRRGLLWAVQKRLTLLQTATHFGASEQMVQFRCNMTRVILTK